MCTKALARAASSSRLVKPLLRLSHLHINFFYDHPPVYTLNCVKGVLLGKAGTFRRWPHWKEFGTWRAYLHRGYWDTGPFPSLCLPVTMKQAGSLSMCTHLNATKHRLKPQEIEVQCNLLFQVMSGILLQQSWIRLKAADPAAKNSELS